MHKNRQEWERNRFLKQRSSKRSSWCYCDRNLVREGQKCSICFRVLGSKYKLKSRKKDFFEEG